MNTYYTINFNLLNITKLGGGIAADLVPEQRYKPLKDRLIS